jgi:outer membrane protein assembly factor BamE (lipoprotein component of BamABCDE complex)
MKLLLRTLVLITIMAAWSGCGADYHARKVQSDSRSRSLTLGAVQRDIRVGMSGAEVAEALGSPNIVSTDENGREVWIYDKFATDVVSSESGWSIFGIGGGAGSGAAGAGGIGSGGRSGARSSSQRTLTVIIKFDDARKVRDFAYHSSQF